MHRCLELIDRGRASAQVSETADEEAGPESDVLNKINHAKHHHCTLIIVVEIRIIILDAIVIGLSIVVFKALSWTLRRLQRKRNHRIRFIGVNTESYKFRG